MGGEVSFLFFLSFWFVDWRTRESYQIGNASQRQRSIGSRTLEEEVGSPFIRAAKMLSTLVEWQILASASGKRRSETRSIMQLSYRAHGSVSVSVPVSVSVSAMSTSFFPSSVVDTDVRLGETVVRNLMEVKEEV